ncbi:MAG: hypothetical protein ACOYZ7_20430 [Chloroflexota bacterium]
MTGNGTLSANQQRAIAALLSEPTIRDAAKKAGIGERTLYRYLADPMFKAELRKRQDEILAATTAALVGMTGDAVATLRAVMQNKDAGDAVKVRAALGWLAHTRNAVELDDLAQRITELEERMKR